MITRGIVKAVDYSTQQLQVRIPILDGNDFNGVKDKDLSWASILAIPGIEVNYQKGDIVIVGFEDNNKGKPIVLGYLKSALSKNKNIIYPEIQTSKMQAFEEAKFPKNTRIGNISYGTLFSLNIPKVAKFSYNINNKYVIKDPTILKGFQVNFAPLNVFTEEQLKYIHIDSIENGECIFSMDPIYSFFLNIEYKDMEGNIVLNDGAQVTSVKIISQNNNYILEMSTSKDIFYGRITSTEIRNNSLVITAGPFSGTSTLLEGYHCEITDIDFLSCKIELIDNDMISKSSTFTSSTLESALEINYIIDY